MKNTAVYNLDFANNSVSESFRIALSVAPAGMVISDATGNIVLVNANFEKMLGFSAADLRAQPVALFVPILIPSSTSSYFCKRSTGEVFPVELAVTQFDLPEGQFTVTSVNDISERSTIDQQVIARNKILERSNLDLENFAYLASHDLQAPMRAVASFAGLIKEQLDVSQNSEVAEYVNILVKAARDMKALLQALLDYSRLSSVGKSRTDTVDLLVLVRTVSEEIVLAFGEIQIAYENLPSVSGSPVLLKQLFSNILSNSHKFRKPGSVAQVEITAKELESQWQIAVSDHGVGMEEKFLGRAFTIFTYDEDSPRNAGSGMGLTVCRKITDIHEGKIWCESERGVGSTFYFTLPKAILKFS